MKRFLPIASAILIALSTIVNPATAQDLQYVRKQLIKLCSPELYGRGYYKRGDGIAADYIAGQLKQVGAKPFGASYLQPYHFNVNVINEVVVKFNGQELKYATDYVINPKSSSLNGVFQPVRIDASVMKDPHKLIAALNEGQAPKVILVDSTGLNNPDLFRLVTAMAFEKQYGIAGLIEVFSYTPVSGPGRGVMRIPHIMVNRASVPANLDQVEINISNEYNENYPTQNVVGYIQGQTNQFIVYTAHYDAFGCFGEKNLYQGAEDNASGTAMVLDLARHYADGPKPYYSIAYMLFSGEEAGLLGSTFYVNNPLFPLDQIKLVINLDT